SNSGSPIGALSTAAAPRHASSVSSGSDVPVARIAAPPRRPSTSSRSGAIATSTRFACSITSGPTPSPARQTRLRLDELSPPRPPPRPGPEAGLRHGGVPAAEDTADSLPRRVVLAGLLPVPRHRGPPVLAVPQVDRVDDRVRRPPEPAARPGPHGA